MRHSSLSSSILARAFLLWPFFSATNASHSRTRAQLQEADGASSSSISTTLFADLERLSRLVDVSYCIGSTGVRKPFDCLSRCKEFPGLSLQTTWSTGPLMGDSCGYIAVDSGEGQGRRQQQQQQTGAIVVAFRGTYSIANTIVDLSTVPQEYVPYPAPSPPPSSPESKRSPDEESPSPSMEQGARCNNCTVHLGFWESWQMAREIVLPQLKSLREKYPSHQLHLVGHSLGGAVACLAALELKLSHGWGNDQDMIVTTFGEPRVGNHQLARFIDRTFNLTVSSPSLPSSLDAEQRTYRRITHINDPVPLLPLDEWGYRPHGGEIFISKQELQPTEADVRICLGDSDPECSVGAETGILGHVRRLLHFASASSSVDEFIGARNLPTRFKLWQLFFAHRDYFWRLGLCVPGGDPANWRGGKWGSGDAGASGEL